LINNRLERRGRMELDDRALPLTRRQLDIWLAQKAGRSGTEWQLGLFVRIEGTVKPDLLEWTIRQVLQEAEPLRATFFETDVQVFQRAIDYSDVELAFYDLSRSHHPVREAREIASSIQRTPMPFTDPLLKFALFRTRPDEYYWFTSCHHIIIGGLSIALVGRRLQLSSLQLFLARPFLLPSSARCRTWSAASWNTKRPPIISKIRPIGAGSFHRKADRIIGYPEPRESVIRIGLFAPNSKTRTDHRMRRG
jgi:hypothetical protein